MKTATLRFEGYPGEEIVVRVAPIPMEDYFGILVDFTKFTKRGTSEQLMGLFGRFAELALESWTFPEPADAKGIRRRDVNLALAMIQQWLDEVGRVPLPLPVGSSGTEQSPEDSTLRRANRSRNRPS